jgi:hypothetical protein
MKETVQIIFIGHWAHIDRVRHLLRKYIPHKVYFVYKEEVHEHDKEMEEHRMAMKKELEKELPAWVKKKSEMVLLPLFNFEELFPKILSIMAKERKKGNEVIANIHGTSVLAGIATTMAAALTGSKVYGVIPKAWKVVNPDVSDKEKILRTVGAAGIYEIKMPLLPTLPSGSEKAVLHHLLKSKGKLKGKLSNISTEIGLEYLGANLKKPASGVVKLSKTISKLRNDDLIETQRIGRKNFEIVLTEKGKMIAEVSSILGA